MYLRKLRWKKYKTFSLIYFFYPGKRSPDQIIKSTYILDCIKRLGKPGDSVLNMGCGYGAIDNYLSTLGYKVTGVDISNDIPLSKKSLKDWIFKGYNFFRGNSFLFIKSDALKFISSQPRGSFDFVIDGCAVHEFNSDVFENVTKGYLQFYFESQRVLRCDGYIVQASDVLLTDSSSSRLEGFRTEEELLTVAKNVGFSFPQQIQEKSTSEVFKYHGNLGIFGVCAQKVCRDLN